MDWVSVFTTMIRNRKAEVHVASYGLAWETFTLKEIKRGVEKLHRIITGCPLVNRDYNA